MIVKKKQNPASTSTKAKRSGKKLDNPISANVLIVCGVAASAGGLEALRAFVSGLELSGQIAYVIAQHMSPQHRSMMVELLSRETTIPIFEAAQDLPLVADTIYVGPPNSDIYVKNGKLNLRTPISEIGPKPSADYLFTSIAEEYGERSIGIVMSGTGTDGSHGVRAISAAGGICIAQAPDSAKYDSMPVAAIKAGSDLVLRPEEIANQLLTIIDRPKLDVK